MKVRHRSASATIYRKTKQYPFYRVAYRADGKRVIRNFKTYSEAKKVAGAKAKELHAGNGIGASLTKAEATTYKFAAKKLSELAVQLNADRLDTPLAKLPLEEVIVEYVEAKLAFGHRRLIEAVNGFLGTVAKVHRIKVSIATTEYLRDRQRLTTPVAEGRRPALSPKAHYQESLRLKRFAEAMDGDVVDLDKPHIDTFFNEHLSKLGSKSRNHYRGTLRQWIEFCVAHDYLPGGHRLCEARSMHHEKVDGGDIEIYTAEEFALLLEHAHESLRPALAIAGLAGLRTQEILRLEWPDVWRRPGYIEVTRGKAKTRQRRLVPICSALKASLQPHEGKAVGRIWTGKEQYFHQLFREACEAAGINRRDNGLRHSFISNRLAETQNEHQVAAEAGSSATMLHKHYKEVVTPADAQKWFSVVTPTCAPSLPSDDGGEAPAP